MSPLLAGLGLALVASLLLNGSYLLQHAGASSAPTVTPLHPLRTVAGLLRSRWWLAGLVLGLLGWSLHVGGLSLAPLSLVQAFAAAGLAVAVPAAAWLLHERLTRKELGAVALMVVAIAALAVGAHGARVGAAVPTGALTAALAAAGIAAAALALRPGASPPALGAAAGILYGAGDAATKAATSAAHGGTAVGALLTPWPALVLVLSAGAFFAFQRGLQSGRAVPVVALMTVMTEATATAAGLVVFGDPLGSGGTIATLHVVAFVAIAVAAWRLAPSPALLGALAAPSAHARPTTAT